MQEMPAVRSIRDDYKSKGLEIIALSFDSDYGKFLKVIGEQGMDWINIYNDKKFVNSCGGYGPIPQAFLIDAIDINRIFNKVHYFEEAFSFAEHYSKERLLAARLKPDRDTDNQ